MARPEKYTDADYLAWIESQVLSGRSVTDIKPTELQKSIGGKYSRCQEVLTLAQDKLADQINATLPSMPVWFRNFITQLVEQTQKVAESQWPPVGRGINEAIQGATIVFESQKTEIDSQLLEHLEQIRILETIGEDNVTRIENIQRQLTDAMNELSTLRSKNAGLEAELAATKDQQANIL
jgi:DNA repair exonuclease SbcCD ATPase subunit